MPLHLDHTDGVEKDQLRSLYTRYLEQLASPSLVLRDDILKILVEMEETMESILSKEPIEISPRRYHLYDLEKKGKDHFHYQWAQESELMKKKLGLPGLSTQHLLSQVGREVDKVLYKNIFLSGTDTIDTAETLPDLGGGESHSASTTNTSTTSPSSSPSPTPSTLSHSSTISNPSSSGNRLQKGRFLGDNPGKNPSPVSSKLSSGTSLEIPKYEDICKELGIIYTKHSDGKDTPFVPTQDIPGIEKGSGRGFERGKKQTQKFFELLGILRNISTPDGGFIDTRDILVDFQEETPDDMIRTIPYLVIRIPRIDRTILISDEIGEATFVFDSVIDISITRSQNKEEFESLLGAKRFTYNKKWGANIVESLLNNWRKESEKDSTEKLSNQGTDTEAIDHLSNLSGDSTSGSIIPGNTISASVLQKNSIKPRIKLDRAVLFLDRENIRKYLEAFRVVGGVESLAELSTGNPKPSDKVVLSNGEKILWQAYLKEAARYFSKLKEGEEYKPASALNKLCKMIGIERESKRMELGTEYFQNKENIRKDLEAFRVVGGVESIGKLNLSNPEENTKVVVSSGEEIKWRTYLRQAVNYLPKPKEGEEGEHGQASALDELCRMIGVKREKRVELGKEYFQNKENIRKDLEAFRVKGGLISLEKLSMTKPKQTDEVELTNKEKMTWNTYLLQAKSFY